MEIKTSTWGQVYQIGILVIKVLVVVFAITGSIQLFKAIFKSVVFDKYPLADYQYTMPSITSDGKTVARSEEELNNSRKLQMLEDYSGAISMLLVSGGLYLLAKKQNN